jgi:hypothetical protein
MTYTPRIVDATYKADVRSLMGFSSDELPDNEISDLIHLAPAEARVIAEVVDWATIKTANNDDTVALQNAVIAGVAYNLCDAVVKKHKVIVRIDPHEERANPIDWKALKQYYQEKMWGHIGDISTYVIPDKTTLDLAAHEEDLDLEYLH